jgi:hypothetical protein
VNLEDKTRRELPIQPHKRDTVDKKPAKDYGIELHAMTFSMDGGLLFMRVKNLGFAWYTQNATQANSGETTWLNTMEPPCWMNQDPNMLIYYSPDSRWLATRSAARDSVDFWRLDSHRAVFSRA